MFLFPPHNFIWMPFHQNLCYDACFGLILSSSSRTLQNTCGFLSYHLYWESYSHCHEIALIQRHLTVSTVAQQISSLFSLQLMIYKADSKAFQNHCLSRQSETNPWCCSDYHEEGACFNVLAKTKSCSTPSTTLAPLVILWVIDLDGKSVFHAVEASLRVIFQQPNSKSSGSRKSTRNQIQELWLQKLTINPVYFVLWRPQ